MVIRRLELTDFRNYERATIDLDAGVTAVIGDNGQGKTSLAEAMSYLATLRSFRGAANDALVRRGAETAYVRAEIHREDGREVLVEAEINRAGRNRVLVNRQRLARSRDLLGVVRTTVFAPTDLELVRGGPAVRREFLDDALVALSVRNDTLITEVERIVRQRNVLLKQAAGRLGGDLEMTLDVWDAKFTETGERLGAERAALVERLGPRVDEAYALLAGAPAGVRLDYRPEWREGAGLAAALASARGDDVRRGVSTVGPHRDDLSAGLNGMEARTTASQGESRTLALALRLGVHRLVTESTGEPPLLVLDDVLSELDPRRCEALLGHLPAGQVIITTASPLPAAAVPDTVVVIASGRVVEAQR